MGKSVKLFADFKKSDLIIASPLGLKLILQNEKSFLSSIEVLIIDRFHVIEMQNVDHLYEVLDKMNTVPHHKDIKYELDKIRDYYFEDLQKYVRQTILYSDYNSRDIQFCKSKYCANINGWI